MRPAKEIKLIIEEIKKSQAHELERSCRCERTQILRIFPITPNRKTKIDLI
jgi:hypothetical protein